MARSVAIAIDFYNKPTLNRLLLYATQDTQEHPTTPR